MPGKQPAATVTLDQARAFWHRKQGLAAPGGDREGEDPVDADGGTARAAKLDIVNPPPVILPAPAARGAPTRGRRRAGRALRRETGGRV